jgi:enterochelin esterase-like enzyme
MSRRHVVALGAIALACAFVAVGFVGVDRYGRNYWLYRGFPPPHDPAYVTQAGTQEHIQVTSPAVGGRSQDVYVYLPPGYADNPTRRYPVLYLLHGFPGRPLAFMLTVRMGVVEDELVAKNLAQPLILVMPFGSTGTFTDKEWANGVRQGEGWATFVARDVVHAVDLQYRTIANRSGRAIAGLSEGGYGALNIALQHPGEFGVVESWSGYEQAPKIRSIFGESSRQLDANTPFLTLPHVARTLRRDGTFIWFYTGHGDQGARENRAFASDLRRLRVPHDFLEPSGGHNWALWRGEAEAAYMAAAGRLAGG